MSPKKTANRKMARTQGNPRPVEEPDHIHLPSVHIRLAEHTGWDYEEDLYALPAGRVERIIRFVAFEPGEPALVRVTTDVLCEEEQAYFAEILPVLMDEGSPEANDEMERRARKECERQLLIAAGEELACARCGCSQSRSCSGGCCWATKTLCSRCV
jgi:hypothetical protein